MLYTKLHNWIFRNKIKREAEQCAEQREAEQRARNIFALHATPEQLDELCLHTITGAPVPSKKT